MNNQHAWLNSARQADEQPTPDTDEQPTRMNNQHGTRMNNQAELKVFTRTRAHPSGPLAPVSKQGKNETRQSRVRAESKLSGAGA